MEPRARSTLSSLAGQDPTESWGMQLGQGLGEGGSWGPGDLEGLGRVTGACARSGSTHTPAGVLVFVIIRICSCPLN